MILTKSAAFDSNYCLDTIFTCKRFILPMFGPENELAIIGRENVMKLVNFGHKPGTKIVGGQNETQ